MGKKDRVYICHTFYHVYIACLKELNLPAGERGRVDLLLSSMSNDFGDLKKRAQECGLFHEVYPFEEKEESYFPELKKYHTLRGNLLLHMIARIKYTKLLGKLEEKFVPVNLREYADVYVFCDSDPIGYYLNYKKIFYHALEDGLDCIRYYDTARYDNRGHFGLKAWMASKNLIFIQNGYAKYCLDMEVNNISVLPYPCPKYVESPREPLVTALTQEDKQLLLRLFIKDINQIQEKLKTQGDTQEKILVLSEPLCSLKVREQIFKDIIEEFGKPDHKEALVFIKPHPRDMLDYPKLFPSHIVLESKFPMEILNFIPGLYFRRVISVFTVPTSIQFAQEKIFLGEDYMDKYEPPHIHRQNEHITP